MQPLRRRLESYTPPCSTWDPQAGSIWPYCSGDPVNACLPCHILLLLVHEVQHLLLESHLVSSFYSFLLEYIHDLLLGTCQYLCHFSSDSLREGDSVLLGVDATLLLLKDLCTLNAQKV